MGSGVKTSRPGFLCNFGHRVKISSWPTPKQHEPHVCGCTSVYKSLNDLKPNPNPKPQTAEESSKECSKEPTKTPKGTPEGNPLKEPSQEPLKGTLKETLRG